MKYETQSKFLPIGSFKKIKDLVMDKDFPWRRRDHMTRNTGDKMYFTYSVYNKMMSTSELYEPYIIPILKQLHAVAPIHIRANIFISELFKTSQWHRDYDFKCKTAILYLNNCDGGTELKIDDKVTFIKADANKMLIFDTSVLHRIITSKKEPVRYIINFNYFEKNEK